MFTTKDFYVAQERYADQLHNAKTNRILKDVPNSTGNFARRLGMACLVCITMLTMLSHSASAAPTQGKPTNMNCVNPHATQEIRCGRKKSQEVRKPTKIKRPAGRGYIP